MDWSQRTLIVFLHFEISSSSRLHSSLFSGMLFVQSMIKMMEKTKQRQLTSGEDSKDWLSR